VVPGPANHDPLRRLVIRGMAPRRAALLGSLAALAVAAGVARFGDDLGHAAQGLSLVVPVMATAVVGGRRPAQFVAALATLLFTLILPPLGTLHVRFAEDVVALVVFFLVAFAVGGLVAHRIEALSEIQEQRAALLRSVSHDLRTPLAAIGAAVSELQTVGLHPPDVQARLLELVGEEAERLDRLVANLLSLARIEGGGLEPRRQAVDLEELVQLASGRLAHALDGVEVRVDASPDLPLVLGDQLLLEQVVTNLLDNASRHTPKGSPIDVVIRRAGRSLRMVVVDHGPGVAEEDTERIFEPFHSGPMAGNGGVGLAICRSVLEAHGGTITVGAFPGGGAAFTVALPCR
jgi:K+-sensing histidine kinase KdpD